MEVIRKLDLDDLKQIVTLRIAIQNYDLTCVGGNNTILSEDKLTKETETYIKKHLNKDLFMFGLFISDELVSNCGFYVERHFPTYNNKSGFVGYICNVFTKESNRQKGYQKKVFNELLKYAKSIGITNFKLSSKNEYAINVYKLFGFVKNDNIYSLKVDL